MNIIASIKAQAGKLKLQSTSIYEKYILALFSLGLPAIAFVYGDWRAALTVFVVSQIILGFVALRGTK